MLFTKHSIFLALSMARMASTRAATPTLYAVLGVPKSASTEEIKAAFRKARTVHKVPTKLMQFIKYDYHIRRHHVHCRGLGKFTRMPPKVHLSHSRATLNGS